MPTYIIVIKLWTTLLVVVGAYYLVRNLLFKIRYTNPDKLSYSDFRPGDPVFDKKSYSPIGYVQSVQCDYRRGDHLITLDIQIRTKEVTKAITIDLNLAKAFMIIGSKKCKKKPKESRDKVKQD